MVNFSEIQAVAISIVGFKEEYNIQLSDQQKTSTSGLWVNSLPGVDLISVQKSLVVKEDLTTETVSEYLTRIYNEELNAVIFAFINQRIGSVKTKEILKADPLEITPIFTDNILAFAEAFQHQLAIRMLLDAANTKEFNAVTEAMRQNWKNNAQWLNHKLKGYDFDNNGERAHFKGLLEVLAEYFEGVHEIYFPTIQSFFG